MHSCNSGTDRPMSDRPGHSHFLQHAGTPYIPTLTGLRGVVALWVVLYHLRAYITAAFPQMPDPVLRFLMSGFMGVDIFFVLSAFVMSHVYAGMFDQVGRRSYAYFMTLRLARIYPLHLLMLCAYGGAVLFFIVMGIKQPEPVARWSLPCFTESLLLIQSWGFHSHSCFNGVAWSISVEWLAYLAFPFLVPLFARIRNPAVALAGGGAALGGMILYLISIGLDSTLAFEGFATVPRMAGGFIAGCFLYRVFQLVKGSPALWTAASLLSWVALVACLAMGFNLLAAVFCSLVVLTHAYDQGPVAALLRSRAAQFLGDVSYALYISHFATVDLYVRLFRLETLEQRPFPQLLGIIALFLAIVLGVATILHYFAEVPSRRLLGRLSRSWLGPRRAGESTAAADPRSR